MYINLECIPCFFKQALFAAKAATSDESKVRQVLDRVAGLMPEISMYSTPPETAVSIYSAVREVTGVSDPLLKHKNESIENALSLYEDLKSIVLSSEDPLRTAVKIAIAGNVIDFGADPDFNLQDELQNILETTLAVDHYESFRQSAEKACKVLYLGDNAGETVLDRLLIETLGKDTVYAVRDKPIINDATLQEAQRSGIDQVAKIIPNGCSAPGTILKRCSQEFLDIFYQADLIVSKGQGNLESLSEQQGPIFYLLKVKCQVVAQHLGTGIGGIILKDAGIKEESILR